MIITEHGCACGLSMRRNVRIVWLVEGRILLFSNIYLCKKNHHEMHQNIHTTGKFPAVTSYSLGTALLTVVTQLLFWVPLISCASLWRAGETKTGESVKYFPYYVTKFSELRSMNVSVEVFLNVRKPTCHLSALYERFLIKFNVCSHYINLRDFRMDPDLTSWALFSSKRPRFLHFFDNHHRYFDDTCSHWGVCVYRLLLCYFCLSLIYSRCHWPRAV
jgi:hypothetical protein